MLRTRLTALAIGATLAAAGAPSAEAAYVHKEAARAYLVKAVKAGAPRVMLRDERAGFFHAERVWVEPSARCRRHADVRVSCRFVARLVPDAAHRRANWWPISCRGSATVGLLADGRLKGEQRDYVCRTIRP